MYGGVHVIHSLIFEILVDFQNDSFGDYFVNLLWCCHNKTQTRNEARNNFFIVVLGAQMCHLRKPRVLSPLRSLRA